MSPLKWPGLGRQNMRGIFSRDDSWLVPAFTLLILAMIWGGTVHWTARERAAAEHDVAISAQNLSGVYGVQMLRALREIDLTINVVRYACEQRGLDHALSNLEADLLVPSALVFVINVTDRRGEVVASNNDNAEESRHAADQPYFRFFHDQARLGDSLYVGSAVLDPKTGKSRMRFARRLTAPDGAFAGVVSVSIDPEYFTSAYEASRMGAHGTLGVFGPQGHLMVARSGDQVIRGDGKIELKPLVSATPKSDDEVTRLLNPWDGVTRYTVFERLNNFGITTVVGLSEDEQLAPFHMRERAYLWQASFVSALVIVLGLLMRQLMRSRSRVRKAQDTYQAASEASQDATFVLHGIGNVSGEITDFALTDTNTRGATLLGMDKPSMLGKPLDTLLPQARGSSVFVVLSHVMNTGEIIDQEWENREPTIHAQWLHAQVVRAGDGVVAIVRDISERKRFESELVRRNTELTALNSKLTETHAQLVQSEKLASIGMLAAGIAHEINNPIGFVLSNIGSLDGYMRSLFEMLDAYQDTERFLSDPSVAAKINALKNRVELGYLREDIPALMRETKDGIERVRKIVQDLKNFSHVDNSHEWQMVNLHDGINSTLNVVNNEIKYKADVVKQYGDMPLVECLPSEINQVVMNLLVNAAHAIGDERGTITIRTGCDADQAWFEVEDSGCGISPENMAKIFDPFFTTKPVGKGTGLGLSLSYGIINKHAGNMSASSVVGKGTTFRVTLPVSHASQSLEEAPVLAEVA
jgi:two-component system NtrC family sensor kinase